MPQTLPETGFRSPGLRKCMCTHDTPGPVVCDAEHNPATALVGQRNAVLHQFIEMKAAPRLLEFHAGPLWTFQQGPKLLG